MEKLKLYANNKKAFFSLIVLFLLVVATFSLPKVFAGSSFFTSDITNMVSGGYSDVKWFMTIAIVLITFGILYTINKNDFQLAPSFIVLIIAVVVGIAVWNDMVGEKIGISEKGKLKTSSGAMIDTSTVVPLETKIQNLMQK